MIKRDSRMFKGFAQDHEAELHTRKHLRGSQ